MESKMKSTHLSKVAMVALALGAIAASSQADFYYESGSVSTNLPNPNITYRYYEEYDVGPSGGRLCQNPDQPWGPLVPCERTLSVTEQCELVEGGKWNYELGECSHFSTTVTEDPNSSDYYIDPVTGQRIPILHGTAAPPTLEALTKAIAAMKFVDGAYFILSKEQVPGYQELIKNLFSGTKTLLQYLNSQMKP
jgi:hypothetical protein